MRTESDSCERSIGKQIFGFQIGEKFRFLSEYRLDLIETDRTSGSRMKRAHKTKQKNCRKAD